MYKIKLTLPTKQKYVNHPGLNVASIPAAVEIGSEKRAETRIPMIRNLAISNEI